MKARTVLKSGQPSWRLATPEVEAFVTETGGHLGPVSFRIPGQTVQPLSVAPWAEDKINPALPPIMKVLRGDFFCLPFGGNATPFQGERHPVHGETANSKWKLEARGAGRLHLRLATRIRRGQVDKHIVLRPGHTAIYQRHIISGMTGPMSPGHHAMLKFPDAPGSGLISTSRFVHGEAIPEHLEHPEQGGYSWLKPGGTFNSLRRVPTLDGRTTDLSVYPARRGFEDFILLVADPRQPLAWTAVTFPDEGYVWFALKDPRVLRETVFWMSNGGRHYPPWNGRHVNVLGLEEVTAYWGGLAESAARNPLSSRCFATCLKLTPEKPLAVNYIMAVAPAPKGFDRVKAVTPAADNQSVTLTSRSGMRICVPLDLEFLGVGKLRPAPVR